MPAIGVASLLAISVKPGGSAVTLSPWLIQTSSMPWPFGVGAILDAVEQAPVAARAHLGVAELAHAPALDLAAELHRHRLHAVADAEHRHAALHTASGARGVSPSVTLSRAARQDDPGGRELADERVGDVDRDGSRSRRAARARGARSAA